MPLTAIVKRDDVQSEIHIITSKVVCACEVIRYTSCAGDASALLRPNTDVVIALVPAAATVATSPSCTPSDLKAIHGSISSAIDIAAWRCTGSLIDESLDCGQMLCPSSRSTCSPSQGHQPGPENRDETQLLVALAQLQEALEDVIGILICHHDICCRHVGVSQYGAVGLMRRVDEGLEDFLGELTSLCCRRSAHHLLDDVRGKLVSRKR